MTEPRPRTGATRVPSSGRRLGWRIWQQLPLAVLLVPLWMLLWGSVSWLSFLSGVVVAVLVGAVFYLPPVELSGRFNPFWGLVFLGRFLADLVVASGQVAWLALRPRALRGSAVVAAPLTTRSDFVMTLTAIALSLVPGSLVVEVDRGHSILYLHAIDVTDGAGVERVRARVRSVERGIIRAVGPRQDLEAIR